MAPDEPTSPAFGDSTSQDSQRHNASPDDEHADLTTTLGNGDDQDKRNYSDKMDDETPEALDGANLSQLELELDSPHNMSPGISRRSSFSGSSSYQDSLGQFSGLPPLDRLTVLDILDNFAISSRLERIQRGISAHAQKVRSSREALKSRSQQARERMVEEWRRRVPSTEDQLEGYKQRMRRNVEKLGRKWNDTRVITLRQKISFICGVMNILVSGLLMGAFPEYFHVWYTAQFVYFMPIRIFMYHRIGWHYFLVDLCYFVNLLLMLSIWVFPGSKRLFLAVFCLAFGNNAVAIAFWRNSLVFHSLSKVLTLFIHIMPCATIHCMVHLLRQDQQAERFPGIWIVKTSPPGTPGSYGNILSMLTWSTIAYAFWQFLYYFLILVRKKDKIAAGRRPTSFTFLRQSYSNVWIGKVVLSLPARLQQPTFMMIQYSYAVLTMLPCPIWFYYKYASAAFLTFVFTWSVYNGATYYIDVFGNRFQKELEAMKAEVAKWQSTSDTILNSPLLIPQTHESVTVAAEYGAESGTDKKSVEEVTDIKVDAEEVVDDIPLLEGLGEKTGL